MTVGARSAAILGAVLALPFAVLYSLLVLHIEPPLRLLGSLTTVGPDQPNVVGSAIVLGAWLLSAGALAVTASPASSSASWSISIRAGSACRTATE